MKKSKEYRSRSRSYEKDRTKNKSRDIKKDKNKRKSYSNSSSNNDKKREYKRDNFDSKLKRLQEVTNKNIKERMDSSFNTDIKIKVPNKGILANMIQENLRNNKKTDRDEINRATVLLRNVDTNTTKTATLMTSHINSIEIEGDREEFIFENSNREYYKINKDFSC